jgi:phosphatidylglycerophosphatase A
MQGFLKHIATLGPIGYMPLAPGTFGTLAALLCILIFSPSIQAHVLLIGIISVVGSFASTAAERAFGQKDSGRIIIDEFGGFFIATLFVPHTVPLQIAAFILFRLFDILKPLMIRKLESTLSGGVGVMADDILAGLYANIILQVYLRVIPH